MKKVVLLSIAILLGTSTFAGIVINSTFTIGRKSQNCSGIGICSAEATTTGVKGGEINGVIDIDYERGSIILSINGNDLLSVQPEKAVFFTNKTVFTFEEDFTFPAEFNAIAKPPQPLKIKKGTYSLSYKNGKYFIEIPF
jgi:hypothetical protein